jgi:hypothetical protein
MSEIPQIRRLLVEDFIEQKDWISKLFIPLNNFMDGTFIALNRGVTLRQNMAADLKIVTVNRVPTSADYIGIPWTIPQKPISLHIGRIVRTDNTAVVLANAVQVQWEYDSSKGLRLTNLIGITPTATATYDLTLAIFTG